MIRVGIIGAGLIGAKRADVISADASSKIVAVADSDTSRAESMASKFGAKAFPNPETLAKSPDVDAVIVATPHKFLSSYTCAAIENGKHVLCEKPMGRNVAEVLRQTEAAAKANVVLMGGFNHRYHPAILKTHAMLRDGSIGAPFLFRCRYGHGGRPGYEKEWRGNADAAGGGELLDQGIHALDLFNWLGGKWSEVYGMTSTNVWPISPLEDNAMAFLKSSDGKTAFLHASWTQWKNLFSFEIFGRDGYLITEGLGGSYGTERLTWGRRKPQSGPPDEQHWEFPGADGSWALEWAEFVRRINSGETGGGNEGLEAMRLVESIYRSSKENKPVSV